MSVYFAASIRIHDPKEYDKYLASAGSVFAKFNGRYLAVDECPEVLEGEWDYTKFVLIEFPTDADFRAWYESDDYQSIVKYRLQSALCNTILVEGLEK